MADYGVHTRNAYDLLDEDAPTKPTKPKEVKEEPKKEVKRTSDRDRPNPRVDGGDRRVDGGERGRGGARGGGRGGGGRGGGRGGARGGGGGGGDSGFRERKEFDGHISRSGKTKEPKKEGAGKFNEGSAHDVIVDGITEDRRRYPRRRKDEEEVPAEAKVETDATNGEATPEVVGDEAAEEKPAAPPVEVVEEEPLTRTYDEFLASKQKLDADLAIQRREALNDESQFKPVKVIVKSEEKNPYIIESSAEEKEKAKKVKKDKAKHMSFDEFIATANNGNTRGGFRGRGARGRDGRKDARSLAVTDTNFPTLDKIVDKPAEKGSKEKK